MNTVRNSAKAVILHDGKILTIQCLSWKKETFYILPGGGQEHGETLIQALQRECLEEIGCTVDVGRLLWLREYIGRNHEFAEVHKDLHGMELMFECRLPPGAEPRAGTNPDDGQVGLAWLEVRTIGDKLFYPQALKPVLQRPWSDSPVYLGDVN